MSARAPVLHRLAVLGWLVACASGALAQGRSGAPTEPEPPLRDRTPQWHALTDARLVLEPGRVVERGTLVLRDGVIVAAGASVPVPAGARVWPLSGRTVYAGFVDLVGSLGVPAALRAPVPGRPAWGPLAELPARFDAKPAPPPPARTLAQLNPSLRPEQRVAAQLDWNAQAAQQLRALGFTAVLAAPRAGVLRGQGALLSTGDAARQGPITGQRDALDLKPLVLLPQAAQHLAFEADRDQYPNSTMGAIALARQALLDAGWHARNRARAPARGTAAAVPNDSLDALLPVLERRQPVLFEAAGESDLGRAARLRDEFALDLIVHGSGHEYRLLDAVAASKLKLVLPLAFPDAPALADADAAADVPLDALEHWARAPSNAAWLEAAGVPLALTADGLSDPAAQFWPRVRQAVRRGWPAERALAALTTRPAEWLGQGAQLGRLQPGARANVVVARGDLFTDAEAEVELTFVDGRPYTTAAHEQPDPRGRWRDDASGRTFAITGTRKAPRWSSDDAAAPGAAADTRAASNTSAVAARLDGAAATPTPRAEGSSAPAAAHPSAPPAPALPPAAASTPALALPPAPATVDASTAPRTPATPPPSERTPAPAPTLASPPPASASTAPAPAPAPASASASAAPAASAAAARARAPACALAAPPGAWSWRQPCGEAAADGTPAVVHVATLRGERLVGTVERADGTLEPWSATRIAPLPAKAPAPEPVVERPAPRYPAGAFGIEPPARPRAVLVRGATVWTQGPAGRLDHADLLVVDGRIARIGRGLEAPADALVVDAAGRHVTPGLIDAHTHIAVDGDVNEATHSVTAEVRIGDVIDPTDISIYRQLAGGLTVGHILHGSANTIGGQSQLIKLRWGERAEGLKIDGAVPTIKFALGENVKGSNWGGRRYPGTRMGVEQVLRDAFTAAREYRAQWARHRASPGTEPEPRRDLQLDALVEVLEGKRLVHIHSYRADEILMFTKFAREQGITVGAFQHVLEGYKVAPEIAALGAGASTFTDWWAFKMEVMDAIPANAALLQRAGVLTSFNSDDAELARRLNTEGAKAIKYGGLSDTDALALVTINPARQLRLDARVGSLEVGKDADFVIWSAHPLDTTTRADETWIEGRRYFQRAEDLRLRQRAREERARLVAQALAAAEAGSGAGRAGAGAGAAAFADAGAGVLADAGDSTAAAATASTPAAEHDARAQAWGATRVQGLMRRALGYRDGQIGAHVCTAEETLFAEGLR